MRKLLMLGSLMALLVPIASRAQFQIGARLGYAPAMGDAVKDGSMSDGVKSQIPLQIDALYKVTKDIGVGAYFAYGIAQLNKDNMCGGESCSGSVMRFGVQGQYAFNDLKAPLTPWVGVGLGYESASIKVGSASGGFSGMEYLNLSAGGDYKVNEQFSVGPYLQLSVAQYGSFNDGSGSQSIPSDAKAMHQWFGFGVAGKFNL
jgi:hypothetical protein